MIDKAETVAKSKTSIFLMEMIIAILIFTVCSSICIKLFADAHIMNKNTEELNHAVVITENVAEIYRYNDGDIIKTTEYFEQCTNNNKSVAVYYDENYEICNEEKASYLLTFSEKEITKDDTTMKNLEIIFSSMDGRNIFSLDVEK